MKIQKTNNNSLIQEGLTKALYEDVSEGYAQEVGEALPQGRSEGMAEVFFEEGIIGLDEGDANAGGKGLAEGGNVLTMYTVQTREVLEVLERDGVNYVKRAYIDKKYEESAWIFRTAYDFFSSEAVKYLPKPDEAESPVWMFADPTWAVPGPDAYRLRLRIPRDEVLLFDLRSWSSILNLSLVGSEEERALFEKEMARQGIKRTQDIMGTGFYPILKRKIEESWKRIFTDPLPEEAYIQGATWLLKKEWVEEVD